MRGAYLPRGYLMGGGGIERGVIEGGSSRGCVLFTLAGVLRVQAKVM